MSKGVPNKKYTPGSEKLMIETMQKEKLGYRETAERFGVRKNLQALVLENERRQRRKRRQFKS